MNAARAETRPMPRIPTPEEEQCAGEIEEAIKARFHRTVKSQFKVQTLEEVQDTYKLALQATDSQGFRDGSRHFSTESNAVTMSGDIRKIWAEEFADHLVKELVNVLPKFSGNTIVLLMTPLVFVADYSDSAGKFRNHLSFRFHISEIGIREFLLKFEEGSTPGGTKAQAGHKTRQDRL